ncbi:hypothetical protein C8Q76DRAFT_159734 [Earliella scabrosa]|nr:hypothetical protein C8Q76DRAFT_159734 [Earliella scabrosa]
MGNSYSIVREEQEEEEFKRLIEAVEIAQQRSARQDDVELGLRSAQPLQGGPPTRPVATHGPPAAHSWYTPAERPPSRPHIPAATSNRLDRSPFVSSTQSEDLPARIIPAPGPPPVVPCLPCCTMPMSEPPQVPAAIHVDVSGQSPPTMSELGREPITIHVVLEERTVPARGRSRSPRPLHSQNSWVSIDPPRPPMYAPGDFERSRSRSRSRSQSLPQSLISLRAASPAPIIVQPPAYAPPPPPPAVQYPTRQSSSGRTTLQRVRIPLGSRSRSPPSVAPSTDRECVLLDGIAWYDQPPRATSERPESREGSSRSSSPHSVRPQHSSRPSQSRFGSPRTATPPGDGVPTLPNLPGSVPPSPRAPSVTSFVMPAQRSLTPPSRRSSRSSRRPVYGGQFDDQMSPSRLVHDRPGFTHRSRCDMVAHRSQPVSRSRSPIVDSLARRRRSRSPSASLDRESDRSRRPRYDVSYPPQDFDQHMGVSRRPIRYSSRSPSSQCCRPPDPRYPSRRVPSGSRWSSRSPVHSSQICRCE